VLQHWQKHPHFGPLLLWTAVWFLFFSGLLFASEYLAQSDLLSQFHTFGSFQARELLAGRLPIWSPGSYAGFPFAADTQTAVFYPPRWITILLSAPYSFSYYAMELEGLLHIWLLGIFTYFLAFNITENRWASLFAAIAFGLGGYITSYPLLQLAILETMAWLPLILLLLRRSMQSHRPIGWLVAAGLLLGLSFFAGHPQTFLHISYLAAFYYFFLTIRARWDWRWIIGLGVLVAGIALLFSAAATIPALQYMQASTRSDVSYEFVAKGFLLFDYLQLVMPGTISVWSPMYVGLPTLIFVLMAWFLRRHADTSTIKAEILFWTAVSGVTLLLSLGNKGILFELVYHIAPGFSLFRQQERIVSLFSLSLALLAAIGFTLWQSADNSTQKRVKQQLLWTMLSILLFSSFLLWATKATEWASVWIRMGGITAVILFLLWKNNHPTWRSLGLILILSAELFLLTQQQLPLQAGSPAVYWPQRAWISTIHNNNPGRIDTLGFIGTNVGELHDIEDIRGISPLRPAALSRFDELSFERRWQLLNVTHIVAQGAFAEGMTAITPVTENVFPNQPLDMTLYAYEAALPRAWMVYDPIMVESDEAAWQAIIQPEFDPATQVILTVGNEETTAVSPPSSPPTVNSTRQTANNLHIQTNSDSDGILVISEWDYPGWQAYVDGKLWPIETANYALQALRLPAGNHDIELRYNPWDVKIGIALSLITLIVAVLLAWKWKPIITTHAPRINSGKYSVAITQISLSGSTVQFWLLGMIFIVLLAFGLRLFHLGSQELRGDEAFSYLFARRPAADIIPALIRGGDPHSPLHYLLLHGWMRLTGDSEFSMRYISLIPSVLIVPLLFQLGRRLGGRRLGMLAAFWVAISQSQIWLAQDVRNQYALTLFWGTAATVILVWKLADSTNSKPTQKTIYWIAYIVAAALAVYSHYYGIFILAAHGGYLWWPKNGRLQRISKWILAGLAAGILFLPWAITSLQSTLAAGQLSESSTPKLAQYLTEVGIELLMGSTITSWWSRWLLVGILFVMLIGVRWLFKNNPRWGALLVAWSGSTLLFIYLIRFSRATFNNFYVSVAAPAIWLLFSVGLTILWKQRWLGWRILAILSALLVLSANVISLNNQYFNPAHSRSNGYRDVVATMEAGKQDGDLFLTQFPDPVWGYYLRNVTVPLTMQPATASTPANEVEQKLQELTETYDRIWFAPHLSPSWDSENIVGRWLDYHLLNESQLDYNQLQLRSFRPKRTVNEATTSINTTLNEQISLHSVHITVNGQPIDPHKPIPIAAGDQMSVSLIWEAMEPIAEPYTVFAHIIAEDGATVAQHDGGPLFGTRPTTGWEVGELLIDRHEIEIINTGHAVNSSLTVGMYDSNTIERIPFANGETALKLATIVIESE